MSLLSNTRPFSPAAMCLPAILVLSLSGCGGPAISRVAGEVAFDGKPVATGVVVYEPIGGDAPARSLVIKDGKYEATSEMKLAPGKYLVRITAPDLSKSNPAAAGGPNDPAPPVYPLLPPAWNVQSQLQVELQGGDNTVNFTGTRTQPPTAETL